MDECYSEELGRKKSRIFEFFKDGDLQKAIVKGWEVCGQPVAEVPAAVPTAPPEPFLTT